MKAEIFRRPLIVLLLATNTIAFAQEGKITKRHLHKESPGSEIRNRQVQRKIKRKGMGSIQAYNLHRQYQRVHNEEKHIAINH